MEEKTHILVVDDDREILHMIKSALEMSGYGVTTVSDGRTALAQLAEHEPDIVLLDIVMPGLSGLEVLEKIRLHSDVPVIMLTGEKDESIIGSALNLGADDYITKPFRMGELLARIQARLRRA